MICAVRGDGVVCDRHANDRVEGVVGRREMMS